jgi:hypothetical protein
VYGKFLKLLDFESINTSFGRNGRVDKVKIGKISNENIGKFPADKEAKFGCKDGDKFWFGDNEHVSVDMQSGMVHKVTLTPTNVTDA